MKCTTRSRGHRRRRALDEALAFYRDALGLEVDPPGTVASQRVRAHFVVLEPTDAGSRGSRSNCWSLRRGFAHRPVRRQARPGDSPHCAPSRRISRRRSAAQGARRAPDRRDAAPGCPRLAHRVHPSREHPGVLVELIAAAAIGSQCVGEPRSHTAVGRLLPARRRRHVRRRSQAAVGASRAGRRTQPDPACGQAAAGARRAHDDHRCRDRRRRWIPGASISTPSIVATNLDHALAAAGLDRADIDIVLASHLHFDHAGGFTAATVQARLFRAFHGRATSSARRNGRMRSIRTNGTAPATCRRTCSARRRRCPRPGAGR